MSARDLVAFMVRQLVQQPEAVAVEDVSEERDRIIRVRVASADIGRVIGKEGRTAKAIRTVLAVASAKDEKRAKLDILD
jgi:predicted RNA-binding protein YlqC (UPF0109 family)